MKTCFSGILCGLLLIIETSLVFGQTEERPRYAPFSDKHRNARDELGRKQGLWKYYTLNRVLVLEITFQNDVKHGPFIRHSSSNGVITEESNYFDGRRDGEIKKYNYNGTLITEGNYLMGKKTGTWISYYPVNGEKRAQGSYDNNGKQTGNWQYFTSKGNLKAEGGYKSGLREGVWKLYSADGSRSEEKKFQGGKEVGVVTAAANPKKPGKKLPQTNKPNNKNTTPAPVKPPVPANPPSAPSAQPNNQ